LQIEPYDKCVTVEMSWSFISHLLWQDAEKNLMWKWVGLHDYFNYNRGLKTTYW